MRYFKLTEEGLNLFRIMASRDTVLTEGLKVSFNGYQYLQLRGVEYPLRPSEYYEVFPEQEPTEIEWV